MDIKKFSKKDEEYFKKIDGKTVAVENVLMGDDEDIYDKKKYRYDLSIYDGPLDLLLYLVRRNKIEIEDIFVSDITQQYLDIIGPIEDWTEEEIEYAGEFITMAAELIEIKSKLLIPTENVDETPDDLPERDLYRRLEELKMFKMQAEKLQGLETINRFFREPVFSEVAVIVLQMLQHQLHGGSVHIQRHAYPIHGHRLAGGKQYALYGGLDVLHFQCIHVSPLTSFLPTRRSPR